MERRATNALCLALLAGTMLGLSGCGGGNGSVGAVSSVSSPLMISSGPPPDGVVQFPYNGGGFSMTAAGGRAPYTWTWNPVQGATLPPGLSLSSNGDGTATISGVPSVLGTYNVSVQVADSGTPAATTSLIYTINVVDPQSFTITSGAPPPGAVGQSYGGTHIISGHAFTGFPLSASGGLPSYTWNWAAAPGSSLPPGLKIEVLFWGGSTRCCLTIPVIDGTPTKAGSYDVIVRITDSDSPPSEASANYTIVIN